MYRIGCIRIRKVNLESEGHNGNNNNKKLEKPSITVLLKEQNNYFKL